MPASSGGYDSRTGGGGSEVILGRQVQKGATAEDGRLWRANGEVDTGEYTRHALFERRANCYILLLLAPEVATLTDVHPVPEACASVHY